MRDSEPAGSTGSDDALAKVDMSGETSEAPADFTWALTVANWFLIGVVAFIQALMRLRGIPNSEDQMLGLFLGGLLGAAGLSLVPLAIIYVINPKRSGLRLKRLFTITGWCVIAFMFYPLFKS